MGKKNKKSAKKKKTAAKKAATPKLPPQEAEAAPGQDTAAEVERLLSKNRRGEAAGLLEEYLRGEPNDLGAALMLGKIFLEDLEYHKALDLHQGLAARFSDEDMVQNALGMTYASMGRHADALEPLERAAALAPGSWLHQANLGKIHLVMRRPDQARSYLEKALVLAGPEPHPELEELLAHCRGAAPQTVSASVAPPAPAPAEPAPTPRPTAQPGASGQVAIFPDLAEIQAAPAPRQAPPRPSPPEQTKRPLNILFLQNAPCIRNYKTATALKARGHKVTLAWTQASLAQMYPGLSDTVYDASIRISGDRELWDLTGNFDLVHCHNEPDAPTVSALGGRAPVIHDTHDLISLRDRDNASLAFFEGLANRAAAGRVNTTPYQRDKAARLYGASGPSLVFYNYTSLGDLPDAWLPRLSAQDGQTHLVYEGGIGTTAHRDFSAIFKEFSRLGVHVHIYPGRHNPALMESFADSPLVHFHQPVSPKQIIHEMSQYDFGVIPWNLKKGNREFLDTTIANKLFEYLAAGLPVLASPLKSYRDFFADNPVGITFETAAEAVERLPELTALGAAIDFGKQIFTYEGQVHRLEEFYYQVIGAPEKGRASAGDAGEIRTGPASPKASGGSGARQAASGLLAWLDKNGWDGWDPYDLQDHFIQRAKAGNPPSQQEQKSLFAREAADPVGLRRELGIAPKRIPKGLGLLAQARARFSLINSDETQLAEARRLADWLLANPSPGYGNLCWGYPFDWQSVIMIPRDTPSVVVSTAVGQGLWELYSITREEKYLDAARSICRFISQDLKMDDMGERGICFSYTPIDDYHVHNANLFAAAFLARVGAECGEQAWLDLARRGAAYALAEQNPDGSIFYWGRVQNQYSPNKLDHYHSGFEIRCLFELSGLLDAPEISRGYQRYLEFYLANYLLPDGTPKLTPETPYPVDIHAAAEAILLLSRLSGEHAELLPLAEKVSAWTSRNMAMADGGFAYRFAPGQRMDIPHLRWGQAWMALALAELLSARLVASGEWGDARLGREGPGVKAKVSHRPEEVWSLARDYQAKAGLVPDFIVEDLARALPGGPDPARLAAKIPALIGDPHGWRVLAPDSGGEERLRPAPQPTTEPVSKPPLDVQIMMPPTGDLAYGSKEWAEALFGGAAGDPWGHDWRASQKARYLAALELAKGAASAGGIKTGLDVGCALGHFTLMLAGLFPHAAFTGVDISSQAVEKCRAAHPELTWECDRLPALSRLGGGFDFISALEVIYYVGAENIDASLARLAELLNPGGWLLISTYLNKPPFVTPESFHQAVAKRFAITASTQRHHGLYTQLETTVRNAMNFTSQIERQTQVGAEKIRGFNQAGVELLGDLEVLEWLNQAARNQDGAGFLSHEIVLAQKIA